MGRRKTRSISKAACTLVAVVAVVAAGPARADGPVLRTSLSPRTGLGVRLVPRLALRTRVGVPVVVSGGRAVAVAASGDLVGALGRRFGLFVGYRFSDGPIPIEGPYRREHRARFGGLVHGLGRRVLAAHRLTVGLRAVTPAGGRGPVFALRIDNETSVTVVAHPAARWSVTAGFATSPLSGWDDFLQLRPSLSMHGTVGFGRSARIDGPAFELGYVAAVEAGFFPVALVRKAATAGGGGVDLVVHLALSGRF